MRQDLEGNPRITLRATLFGSLFALALWVLIIFAVVALCSKT